MQTKTTAPRQPKNRAELRETYLLIFDAFAATRSEVAEAVTGGDKAKASRLLNKLRDAGIVATQDVNDESQGINRQGGYAEIVWQAVESYDDHTREEAEALFDRTFPAPAEKPAAKSASDKKAEQHMAEVAAEICPACEQRPVEFVCTAGTDAVMRGERRCGECTRDNAADWSPIEPKTADAKPASKPKPVGKRAAAKAEAHIAEALADKPALPEPKKLVEQVAKATGIRGAKVEPRQGGKRHVIVAQVAGKPALLAYVDPLKRGTGFRVEIANYGGYVTKTVADVAAAAEAVKSSERREPKPAKAKPAPAKPAAKKAPAKKAPAKPAATPAAK